MIPCVRVKEGVEFKITPAGIHILAALNYAAQQISHDITVTSGCDGTHSGPEDPHKRGDAYDVRTHDLPDKHLALAKIQEFLGERFFVWIENEGGENEHIHGQVRKNTVWPPPSIGNHDAVQDAAAEG